jgi:hypothetical protein
MSEVEELKKEVQFLRDLILQMQTRINMLEMRPLTIINNPPTITPQIPYVPYFTAPALPQPQHWPTTICETPARGWSVCNSEGTIKLVS